MKALSRQFFQVLKHFDIFRVLIRVAIRVGKEYHHTVFRISKFDFVQLTVSSNVGTSDFMFHLRLKVIIQRCLPSFEISNLMSVCLKMFTLLAWIY